MVKPATHAPPSQCLQDKDAVHVLEVEDVLDVVSTWTGFELHGFQHVVEQGFHPNIPYMKSRSADGHHLQIHHVKHVDHLHLLNHVVHVVPC